jgi:hypothetical protein
MNMFKMYQNPDDGLSLFTNSQAYLDRNKSLTVPPENYRFNSQTHLRFGENFEQNIARNLQDYKNYIRTPLIGSGYELKQLKKNLYENKITDQNLTNGAKFLSELYGVDNIDYLKGLIRQKGSVENVILAEKKGELRDLNKLKKGSKDYDRSKYYAALYQAPYAAPYQVPYLVPYQVPYAAPNKSTNEVHSKILSLLDKTLSEPSRRPVQNSELFLKQLIKDTYEPNTKMYENKDDLSVLLSKYAKLMKAYKLKTKEVKNGISKLTESLSTSMNIPKRELKPFVNMAIPMMEKERKFLM